MSREITPLVPDEIAEVGRFLAAGFGASEDAGFVRPGVMAWKFFDPRGCPVDSPRAFVCRVDGHIVGFVGVCPTAWHIADDDRQEIPTLHMVDWLADKSQSNVGAYLFLRAHRNFDTAYTLGASSDARRVVAGAGYEEMPAVPVFIRTLRPAYRLKTPRGISGAARFFNDMALSLIAPGRKAEVDVQLRRLVEFGPEIDSLIRRCESGLVFTSRRAKMLNHLLRYPEKNITGYLIEHNGLPIGFALLSVIAHGHARVGKLVECFLPERNPAQWHAAIRALTGELRAMGADFVTACGSTEWTAQALQDSGYRERYRLEFRLRDKHRLVPRDLPFHLTWIEADYAYLP